MEDSNSLYIPLGLKENNELWDGFGREEAIKVLIFNSFTGIIDADNHLIAIWGSTGSGKTTLSVKNAKELAAKKKNVIILHDDVFCPTIPILLPIIKDMDKSLGKIFNGLSDICRRIYYPRINRKNPSRDVRVFFSDPLFIFFKCRRNKH